MIRTLREKPVVKKIVLWAVVAAMVLGIGVGVTAVLGDLVGVGPGLSGGPWVLQVGTEFVSPLTFQSELRLAARQLEQLGFEEGDALLSRARFQAMQSLVRQALEVQEARKAGLKVSNEEVSDRIRSLPELQRDGVFIGVEEYKRLLSFNDVSVAEFERRIRDQILIEKWESLIGAGVFITDREVEQEWARRNQKVRFDFVLVESSRYLPAAAPSEEEIKAHYDSRPDRYQRGESRRVRYVLVDPKSAEDQIPPPGDAELRAVYEADRARFPGPFEQEKDSIGRQVIFQRAQVETDRRAAVFRATVTDPSGLEAAAAQSGLSVRDSGLLVRQSEEIAEFGPAFADSVFAAVPGTLEGPVRTLKGSVVFVVSQVQEARRATLEEAKDDIIGELQQEKSRDAALAAAEKTIATAGNDLAKVGQSLGAEVKSAGWVAKGEAIPALGYDEAVEAAAHAAEAGQIAGPVMTAGGSVVILQVLEKQMTDTGSPAESREAIREELRSGRQRDLVNSMLEAAVKRTDVKTNEEYLRQFGS